MFKHTHLSWSYAFTNHHQNKIIKHWASNLNYKPRTLLIINLKWPCKYTKLFGLFKNIVCIYIKSLKHILF